MILANRVGARQLGRSYLTMLCRLIGYERIWLVSAFLASFSCFLLRATGGGNERCRFPGRINHALPWAKVIGLPGSFGSSCLFPLLPLFSRYDLLIVRGCSSTRSYSTMFCQPVGYERTSQVFGSLACFFCSLRASGDGNQCCRFLVALWPRAL